MAHELEKEYGLSANELLDAINKRFRAKVTLEGAVAEVQLGKIVRALKSNGEIKEFEEYDFDGKPDFGITLNSGNRILIECKNVRNSTEAFRKGGIDVAFKVETQKTRTSNNDPSSRFYSADQFDVLCVCLGKKTRKWSEFVCIRTIHLQRHGKYPSKLAVMHRVPMPNGDLFPNWHRSLLELIRGEYS